MPETAFRGGQCQINEENSMEKKTWLRFLQNGLRADFINMSIAELEPYYVEGMGRGDIDIVSEKIYSEKLRHSDEA